MKFGLILALLVAVSAYARLGETKQQCLARYGKPFETRSVRTGIDGVWYTKDDVNITAEFFQDKCIAISYNVTKSFLTLDIANSLLKAEGSWQIKKQNQNANGVVTQASWARSDGATATLDGNHLMLRVGNYKEIQDQASKEHAQKIERGF